MNDVTVLYYGRSIKSTGHGNFGGTFMTLRDLNLCMSKLTVLFNDVDVTIIMLWQLDQINWSWHGWSDFFDGLMRDLNLCTSNLTVSFNDVDVTVSCYGSS